MVLIIDENIASSSTMDSSNMMSDSLVSLLERPTSLSSRESTLTNKSDESIRSARAAKVFGELITLGENENSLSYSPSPFPRKQGLSNITNVCQKSPGRVLPFGTIQFSTTAKKPAKKLAIEKDCEEGKENEKPHQKKNGKRSKGAISVVEQSVKNTEKVEKSSSSNKSQTKNAKLKNTTPKRKPFQLKHRFSKTNEKQASLAEMAIKQATESVNQSINASRAAKSDHNRNVVVEVSRLRDEWKAEKEEAARFYAEIQKTKRERLDIGTKITSQYARNKVDSEQRKWQERLAELDNEIKFKSEVHVEHQRKLKENEDKRRRISVSIKAEHRNVRKTNIETMRLKSIKETHAFYEHKWAGERDAEEYKKRCEQERRESLAFRNAEGRRQRMEEEERQTMEKDMEHKRLEHKWGGERDAEEYKKQCTQERRESYAFRNAEGRCQRLQEEERQEEKKLKEHQFFELKWASKRDAEEYKKQCAQERRESYAFRNVEGRRQRQEEEERQVHEKNAEHERLEHKWAGERDAEEYKKQCAQERRESLAFRGRECVHHRAVMEELKALAKEKEHEYFLLKWAAQDDVKEYLAEVAEERRKSLAFRNTEGRRHRDLEEQWRCEELQKAHELEQKRSDSQKDVEEYKKKCAERDRASLCFRGRELQTQKLIIQQNQEDDYEKDQQKRELETLARSDVDEYINDCKRRRRKSLALRAKEHRYHLDWKQRQAQTEREQKSRHTKNAALNRKYVELAREKERAKIALDALLHAQCTFSTSNPFGSLLFR